MQNRLFPLGWAEQSACTTGHRLPLQTYRFRPTHGAVVRHYKRLDGGRPLIFLYSDHFGNDIARAPHDHAVSNHDILAPNLILVVQRGVGYRYAAYKYRP